MKAFCVTVADPDSFFANATVIVAARSPGHAKHRVVMAVRESGFGHVRFTGMRVVRASQFDPWTESHPFGLSALEFVCDEAKEKP